MNPARRKWSLTKEAFDKLLDSLGPDPERAAYKYNEIRGNLIKFFEWRGCPFPEDHADETINRVAKRLADGEEVLNPASYCVGVARLLVLEINKERTKERVAITEMSTSPVWESEPANEECHIECLRSCLQNLPTDNRELIIEYYQGEKASKIANRKKLSERLRVPINTLRMRALRLREKLQDCLENCVKEANV
jgi:DNA-directed RNA polymerase specialized sigma24 family protein